MLVPRGGLEPPQPHGRQILSLMCLPISPPRQLISLEIIRTWFLTLTQTLSEVRIKTTHFNL